MIGVDQALELMKASSPILRYNALMAVNCRWICEFYDERDQRQYHYGGKVEAAVFYALTHWLESTPEGRHYAAEQEKQMQNRSNAEPLPLGTYVFLRSDESDARICGYRINDEGITYQVELPSGRVPEGWLTADEFIRQVPNGE